MNCIRCSTKHAFLDIIKTRLSRLVHRKISKIIIEYNDGKQFELFDHMKETKYTTTQTSENRKTASDKKNN